MAIQTYDVIDSERGLLDRSIFIDPDIYQKELEQIFGRAWLFIGHESLIPNINDFFLTYMGEDPVILTRDAKGEIHAFLNMCRHRGNRIVRADDGNAKNFMCAYHGWTYSNEGKLVSVPGLQEAYYGELDVDALGLVPVALLETYAGFVFATWAEDAPTLEEYLGNMRWYMDVPFNRRDGGVELTGPIKWNIYCNWKNSADNFIGDMYHAPISHRSASLARAAVTGNPAPASGYAAPGNQVRPGNGHGLHAHVHESLEEMFSLTRNAQQRQESSEYEKSIRPEMEGRLGTVRSLIQNGHYTVFPNMSWLQGGTVRMWHPRGPAMIEVWAFVYMDKAAPERLKHLRRVSSMSSFGPSGSFEQDDSDNWSQSTLAGKSHVARRYKQVISMGLGHETTHPDLPGTVIPRTHGEINQRAMYKRWQEFMNADSWADISTDPLTAKFEGTATSKG